MTKEILTRDARTTESVQTTYRGFWVPLSPSGKCGFTPPWWTSSPVARFDVKIQSTCSYSVCRALLQKRPMFGALVLVVCGLLPDNRTDFVISAAMMPEWSKGNDLRSFVRCTRGFKPRSWQPAGCQAAPLYHSVLFVKLPPFWMQAAPAQQHICKL